MDMSKWMDKDHKAPTLQKKKLKETEENWKEERYFNTKWSELNKYLI